MGNQKKPFSCSKKVQQTKRRVHKAVIARNSDGNAGERILPVKTTKPTVVGFVSTSQSGSAGLNQAVR